ncbi:MAG: putative transport system, lipoprotein [Bacteroidetes bacterium]|nr:putative transport system, lipoprotein [Bacteroidota bacterium]
MTTKAILNYKLILACLFFVSLVSCGNRDNDYDATGTFETTEVIVSAEVMGEITSFDVQEGQDIVAGQVLGCIDSTQLYLKKLQIEASQKALLSRRPDVRKQIAALEQQIATAYTEKKRVESLVKANAATTKQLDDANAQIAVLEKQLIASKTTLQSTDAGMTNDNSALQAQIGQIDDQLRKCRITSPVSGVLLVKYAEKGELAAAGKALFKAGNMDELILRAYVTADQLGKVKAGQKVKVFADYGKDQPKEYSGTVNWISAKAEFTPKTIQTKDERANLVYAVKIGVKNDGYLKIGMYGDIKF